MKYSPLSIAAIMGLLVSFSCAPAKSQANSVNRQELLDHVYDRCHNDKLSTEELTSYCNYYAELYKIFMTLQRIPDTDVDRGMQFLTNGDSYLSQCAANDAIFAIREKLCTASISSYRAELARRTKGLINR